MNSIHVARVLVLTRIRSILNNRDRRRAQLLSLLLFTPLIYQLVSYGATHTPESLIEYGIAAPLVLTGLAATQILRTLQQFGSFDGIEQLVPVASMRSSVTGFMLADTVTTAGLFSIPLLAVTVPMAITTGAVLLPVLVVAGLLVMLFPVTVIGTLAGMVVKRLLVGYQGRHTVLLRISGFIGVFIAVNLLLRSGISLGSLAVAGTAGRQLTATLLAAAVPSTVSLTGVGLVAGLLMVGIGLIPATTRLTEHVWLYDPGSGQRSRTGSKGFSETGARLYARTLWIRGLRSPERFAHLVIAVFMLFPLGGAALRFPPLIPLLVMFLGAWFIGAGFCLNPLGDDVDQLPLLFHLDLGTDELLWGRIGAGLVLGIPLIILGAVLGPFVGIPSVLSIVAAAASVVTGLVTAGIGLGLGTASPRFDAVQRYGAVTARSPNAIPMIGHLLSGQIGFGLLMLVVFLPEIVGLVPVVSGLKPWVIRLLGLVLLGGIGVAIGSAGWWFARRRLDQHEIE